MCQVGRRIVAVDRVNHANADDIAAGAGIEDRLTGIVPVADAGYDNSPVVLGQRLNAPRPPIFERAAYAGGYNVFIRSQVSADIVEEEMLEFINVDRSLRGCTLVTELSKPRVKRRGVLAEKYGSDGRRVRRRASGQLCTVVEGEPGVCKAAMLDHGAIIVLRFIGDIGEDSTDDAELHAGSVEAGVQFSQIIDPGVLQSLGLESIGGSQVFGSCDDSGSAEQ